LPISPIGYAAESLAVIDVPGFGSAAGSLLSDGAWTFAYDGENRLASATSSTRSLETDATKTANDDRGPKRDPAPSQGVRGIGANKDPMLHPEEPEGPSIDAELGPAARSAAIGARLRGQLSGQEIAGGHALGTLILDKDQYNSIYIRARAQCSRHIADIVNNTAPYWQLIRGRSAYWQESTGTVLIGSPQSGDGGTAISPTNGRTNFGGSR
jgi:hypothetical protein